MKISENTIEILKNFATINGNIVINPDGRMRTITTSKNLLASATIPEVFPYKFGLYDLNEFLGAYGMIEDADIIFDDNQNWLTIKGADSRIMYRFAAINNLVTAEKDIDDIEPDMSFTVTHEQLNTLKKASAALRAPHVEFQEADSDLRKGTVVAIVKDLKNTSTNRFVMNLGGQVHTKDSQFHMDVSNFKFIQADEYSFKISSKNIASIETPSVNYWVALLKHRR